MIATLMKVSGISLYSEYHPLTVNLKGVNK